MSTSLSIAPDLAERAIAFGETSYGATRVTLILTDGRLIYDVVLVWGSEIAKVGSKIITKTDDLDFRIEDIKDLRANGRDT